jgi:hypothetical protein
MRIRGELLKLGISVSATTIATVLRGHGLGPAPRRGPTWREFLRQEAAEMLSCDFLTVETIRLKTLYRSHRLPRVRERSGLPQVCELPGHFGRPQHAFLQPRRWHLTWP